VDELRVDDGESARYRAALECIAASRSDGSPDYGLPRHSAEEEAREVAREALEREA
jgi:hypothetical protein